MKYLGKLFLSLKEIFIIMLLQYIILFLCFIIIGPDSTILFGSVILMVLQIIYIIYKIYKGKDLKFSFNSKTYLPYILLGIGISTVYNMIIFKLGLNKVTNTDFPIILNILCSGIVGPIFEEILFRYDLIRRLEKFNSKRWIIMVFAIVIFGLMHTGITTIIYAMIIGLINSYFYMKDKDIMKPIIVHIASNIFVIFLTGYNTITLILGIILIVVSYFIVRCDK